MDNANPFSFSTPPLNGMTPVTPPSPLGAQVPRQAGGLSLGGKRVLDSPPPPPPPPPPASSYASYLYQPVKDGFNFTPATSSLRQRTRPRETDSVNDEGGADTKISKTADSRLTRAIPSHREHVPKSNAPIGSTYHGELLRDDNKAGASLHTTPRLMQLRGMAPGQTFQVNALEMAILRLDTTRTLVETGSSSGGTFWVHYAAVAAAVQAPAVQALPQAAIEPAAPVNGRAHEQDAPAPVADEPAQTAPQASFDPVNSQLAKTLRARLRKALHNGTGDSTIFEKLLRPTAGPWHELAGKRWGFTPEFLVSVLLVLPSLENDAQRTVLGNAVARLRVPSRGGARGSGGLGGEARKVIGQALAHVAVQARVPLDAIMVFLIGANETTTKLSNNYKKSRHHSPRHTFSGAGADYGIPQALGKRLGREAQQADPAVLDGVLATAGRLSALLRSAKTTLGPALEAVTTAIDASSASAAVKSRVKGRFMTPILPSASESEADELSEGAPS